MKINISTEDLSSARVQLDEQSYIEVRPITHDELATIMPKYSKKGKIPDEENVKLSFEVLERCVIGWKGIEDVEGKEIPFDRKYIKPVLSAILSQDRKVFEKLMDKALVLVNIVEKEEKK